jgi:hypothetical protein
VSLFGTDYAERKQIKIFDGAVMYFPKALAAVSIVSVVGNEQHNPGEALHWSRGKSFDQFNTALRHMVEHKSGQLYAEDIPERVQKIIGNLKVRTLANAAWRVLAALELSIEETGGLTGTDPEFLPESKPPAT